jgi:hypothetical protein
MSEKVGWLAAASWPARPVHPPPRPTPLAPAPTGWRPPSRVRAFALIPIIRLVGDVAKMLGYPVGLVWRLRQRHNP